MSKITKDNLAPIVLFVYNRPTHTRRTIEALQKNELAIDCELFVYSDNARDEKARAGVDAVRAYIKTIMGFKKVTIIEREKNKGLATSIIDGVSDVVNRYGRVIVLEDDIVTSPYFLRFMNDALDYYENEKKVWHISGWNYPIDGDGVDDVFLWRMMNCWGWATWADRWAHFEKDPQKLIDTFDKKDVYRFNLDGAEDFWGHVLANYNGTMNTWAIFWYATIFQNDGLCLNPRQTLVDNIGLDGSGVNCNNDHDFRGIVNRSYGITFTNDIQENENALKQVQCFYKKRYPLAKKIMQGLCKMMNKQ
jgi:hypothetical protein